MIIRHDVDDRHYLDLGERHRASVAYIGGCAGTLVHESWVLTAAHCVAHRLDTLFVVRHLDRDYRIEAITVHPGYGTGDSEHHDIALVQLKEPVRNGEPARLYRRDDELGRSVVFVGRGVFGNGRDGELEDDRKQRGATNTIISVSEHLIGFAFDPPATATALEGISGAGDSGGPAFVTLDSELHVAGVSSHQVDNGCRKATYGVLEYYTRVSSHVPEIEYAMASSSAPVVIEHPVIDAIRDDSLPWLDAAARGDVLKDTAIMNEAFCQSVVLNRPAMGLALLARGVDVRSLTFNGSSLHELVLHLDRRDYFERLTDACRGFGNVHDARSAILPLLIATQGDDPRVTDRIGHVLDQGANIDARTSEGDTALILAGWHTGDPTLVRYLIERGADVDIANDNGDTPLMDAAYLGRTEILELLLASGADPDPRNKRAQSALDKARSEGHEKAVALLGGENDRDGSE